MFITSWYPSREQPVEGIFVQEHAKAVQLYDDVLVLHCTAPDPKLNGIWQLEEETDQRLTSGIPTYRLRVRLSPIPATTYFVRSWGMLRSFQHLVRLGFRPDVIHAHIYEAGASAVLLGRIVHLPVVVTEHFSGFPRKLMKRTDIWKSRLAFEKSHITLPVSEALQHGIEGYGIKTRFRIVPNAVDSKTFFPDFSLKAGDRQKRLLFVGLLDSSHNKGIPFLFRALARLRQQRDDWHLSIVGDGPARSDYERLASELNLSDRVTFHGIKPKDVIAEHMRQADIFVLPSLWENQPCVLLEAMVSGLPVISTSTGGIPEIVDERTGILVPPGDADALCEGINRMLGSLAEYPAEQIAQNARERFCLEAVGARIHEIYDCLTCHHQSEGSS